MKNGRESVIEALDLAKSGELLQASRLLHEMRKYPDLEAEACYGLGLIELCRNKTSNSEAYFNKATQLDPGHADAYYQLAKISDSRGDPVSAVLFLKSALAHRPGHVMAGEALAKHGVFMESHTGPSVRTCNLQLVAAGGHRRY